MIIVSKIKRDPPTLVHLGDTAYQFAPDELGRHVCEVKDKEHAARLLSVSEGFGLPDDEPVPKALVKQMEALKTIEPIKENVVEDTVRLLSDNFPAAIQLTEAVQVQLLDVVERACDELGLTVFDWNSLTPEARDEAIELTLNAMLEEVEPGSTTSGTNDEASGTDGANGSSTTSTVTTTDTTNAGTDNAAPELTAEQKAAELEDLQAQYFAKFGKKPNARAGAPRLRELLSAETPADSEEE